MKPARWLARTSVFHTRAAFLFAQLRQSIHVAGQRSELTLAGSISSGSPACCSQREVSHPGSKVRKGVWIKLISFSCTDSEDRRLSLWRDFPFSPFRPGPCLSRGRSLIGGESIFRRNPEHLSPTPSPSAANRLCGNRTGTWTVCCSQLVPTAENQIHLSPPIFFFF